MFDDHFSDRGEFASILAQFLRIGDWTEATLVGRLNEVLSTRPRWGPALIGRMLATFRTKPITRLLTAFLETDRGFTRVRQKSFLSFADRMLPSAVPGSDRIPRFDSAGQLGDWLGLAPNDLLWYADPAGLNNRTRIAKQRHYGIVWVPKRSGGQRLLEIPKPRLMQIQRKLLTHVLDPIPPHDAAHGFRKSRSTTTYAAPHSGRPVVVRFDLADFFPSVTSGRVYGFFRSLGYPERVSQLLAGLCTTRLSVRDWDQRPNPKADGSDHAVWQRLSGPHLPQGAPTSPALANLAAYRLDVRLAALAKSFDATYTRYADDLAFSLSSLSRTGVEHLRHAVTAIAADEGFAVNAKKSRVMRQSQRQHLAGLVINVKPQASREMYDELKAILTNCVRHGPQSQNRGHHPHFRNHLLGRIAAVAAGNPRRGRKLSSLFDRIIWEISPSAL